MIHLSQLHFVVINQCYRSNNILGYSLGKDFAGWNEKVDQYRIRVALSITRQRDFHLTFRVFRIFLSENYFVAIFLSHCF